MDILTNHILDMILGITPLVLVFLKSYFFGIFLSFAHQWVEVWAGGTQPLLLLQGFIWPKYRFWPFWPKMNIERGVVIYMFLKHSPDDSASKYIGFVGLTPEVPVLFQRYHFFGILALLNKRKRCGMVRNQPMLLLESSCPCSPSFKSVGSRVCLSDQSTLFVLLPIILVSISRFLANSNDIDVKIQFFKANLAKIEKFLEKNLSFLC